MSEDLNYIYTEYCPGDLFWGWHLYSVKVVDGEIKRDKYEWLNKGFILTLMHALEMPLKAERDWYKPETILKFMTLYPSGVLIEGCPFSGCNIVEDQSKAPSFLKQIREDQLLGWKRANPELAGPEQLRLLSEELAAVKAQLEVA